MWFVIVFATWIKMYDSNGENMLNNVVEDTTEGLRL